MLIGIGDSSSDTRKDSAYPLFQFFQLAEPMRGPVGRPIPPASLGMFDRLVIRLGLTIAIWIVGPALALGVHLRKGDSTCKLSRQPSQTAAG